MGGKSESEEILQATCDVYDALVRLKEPVRLRVLNAVDALLTGTEPAEDSNAPARRRMAPADSPSPKGEGERHSPARGNSPETEEAMRRILAALASPKGFDGMTILSLQGLMPDKMKDTTVRNALVALRKRGEVGCSRRGPLSLWTVTKQALA